MADIKAELKSAREWIKKKEYKEALKHCKNVLKVDKENYNGLVFIGVCATEMEQFEQGRQAYRKAIDINGKLILAWQGLCTCIEKSKNSLWSGELVEAYSTLLKEHIKEELKWIEICNKLVEVLKQSNKLEEAANWLQDSIVKYSNSKDVLLVWKKVIALRKAAASSSEAPEATLLSQLLESFQSLLKVSESEEVNVEGEAVEYVKFLMQYSKVSYSGKPSLPDIFNITGQLFTTYGNNIDLLSMLCIIWINMNIDKPVLDEKATLYVEKLLELKTNTVAFARYLCVGYTALVKNNINEAVESFRKASNLRKTDPISLFLMSRCEFALHRHRAVLDTLVSCRGVLPNVQFEVTLQHMETLLCVMEADIILEAELMEKKPKEKELVGGELLSEDDIDVNRSKTNGKIEPLDTAIEMLMNLERDDDVGIKAQLLQIKACASIHGKKYYDAELRLHEALELRDDYKSHFMLGEVYKSLGSESDRAYYPKAYNEYLRAAKLDPYYSPTFVRLGEYQRDFIKDLNKSMKCFEKAHSLDGSNEEAARYLGDTYLQMNMEDKAIDLYEMVTSKALVGQAIWAWVRLGLVNLKLNADKAVVCFQHAVRGDTLISHYWECLAEAYFCKGSYTSALKAFTKALQLDPASTFCKFKIAKVKQMLSMDCDAIEDYEQLLESNPTYIPALLGLAETHLHLEREKLKRTLDGRAVDHAQKAIEYISRALREEPTYTCLWKTAGDSLCALHVVTQQKCRLVIPENLVKILSLDIMDAATKEDIMDIATKCYMMAIKFHENIASLWNDLAVCTFYFGMVIKGQPGEQKICQSMEIVKKALTLEPGNHKLWNTLGVIAGSPGPAQKVCGHSINDIQNPGLSQHAFIKSLEINQLDAQVWTNLGALYLQHDKIQAAHEAFKKAQAADPGLVHAWVGQAIIAESIGDADAMDLFRHTTQLSFHGEGSIAYSQWVCRMLESIKARSISISTRPRADMSHLPEYARSIVANASVALQKSVERYKGDPCAYNTLGLLLEQQALYKQAEDAFSCARKLLNAQPDEDKQAEFLRMVLINQARVLCELGKFDDSIEIFKIVSLDSVIEHCDLALAYYASGQLEKSFNVYESAFAKATVDSDRSAVLSAMGMVQYALKDAESAKQHLLKGSQYEDKSEHGLMALSALGLLHGDGTLTTAALVELSSHKLCNTSSLVEKKAMLLSAFYMLQGQNKAAQRTLAKAILRYPDNAYLWCRLSKYITENNPNEYKSAVHCAKAASLMGPSQMTSKTDAITSLAFPNSFKRSFIKSVQRFVHSHPTHVESWVLLSSALMADLTTKTSPGSSSVVHITKLALTKVDETLNYMRQLPSKSTGNKHLTMYTTLYSWTMQSYVMSNIYYGDVPTAHSFCNQIIPSLNGDNKTQENFIFLKGLATMQEHLSKGDVSSVENIRVMATLATKDVAIWKWKVMSQLYVSLSMLTSAELCLRQVMNLTMQMNMTNASLLITMGLLAVQANHASQDTSWLNQGLDIVNNLLRLDETNPFAIFLRAILFHQEGKQKAAMKYLQKLTLSEDKLISEVQASLVEKWK